MAKHKEIEMGKASIAERLMSKVTKTDTCWIWNGCLTAKGYGRITVVGKTVCYAHRVSYEQFVGPIPTGVIVRHDCDNPRCVNPSHLQLGTVQDNADDMVSRGRAPMNGAKLTEEQVREIRRLYVPYSIEFGCNGLGKKYGLVQSAVHAIVTRKSWSFVGD